MKIRIEKYRAPLVSLLILLLSLLSGCNDQETHEELPIVLPNADEYQVRVLGIGQWAGQIEAIDKEIIIECNDSTCLFSGKELPISAYEFNGTNLVLKFGISERVKCTKASGSSTKHTCTVGLGGAHAIKILWDEISEEEVKKLDGKGSGVDHRKPNLIRVSTGDNFGISGDVAARMKDVPTISLLNKLGLDYDTFGNHNLEKGLGYLQNLINLSNHQYVISNLTNVPQNLQKVAPYAMRYIHSYEKNATPLLLAVVGSVDHSATNMIFSGSLGTVDIADYCATKYAMQDAYAQGARAFLLLTHLAVDQNNVDHQTLYHFSKMLLEMQDEKFQVCPPRFGYSDGDEKAMNKAIYESIVAVIGATARSNAAFLIHRENVGHLLTTTSSMGEMLRTSLEGCRISNALTEPADIAQSWGKPYVWPDACYDAEQNKLQQSYNICSEIDEDNLAAKGNCSYWEMYYGLSSAKKPDQNEALVENIKIDDQALWGLYQGISKNVVTELTAKALKICISGLKLDTDEVINTKACNERANTNFLPMNAQNEEIIKEVYAELKTDAGSKAMVSLLESTLNAGLEALVSAKKTAKPCTGMVNPITDGFCASDMDNKEGNKGGFVFVQVAEKGQLLYDIQAKLKKNDETNTYLNNGLSINFKKPYAQNNIELLPSTCNETLDKLENCKLFYEHYIKNKTEPLPYDKEKTYIKNCFEELDIKTAKEAVTAWQCLYASTTSNVCGDKEKFFKEPVIFKFEPPPDMSDKERETWEALPYSQQSIRNQTTKLGNLVCDAVIAYYKEEKIDVFLINSGAIRQGLKADVKVSNANNVCPYSNSIVVMKVTSKEIAGIIEHGLKFAVSADHGGYLQVGGMRYTYDINAVGEKIKHIELIHYGDAETENSYTSIYHTDLSKCPNKDRCQGGQESCLLRDKSDKYCYYFDYTKSSSVDESTQTYVLGSLDFLYTGGDGFVFPKVPARILDLYSVALVGYFRGTKTNSDCEDDSTYLTSDGLDQDALSKRLEEKRACISIESSESAEPCPSWESL